MRRTVKTQVRDYAAFSSAPFSYRSIVNDLGLDKWNTIKAMQELRQEGLIVPVGIQRNGMYLHVAKAPQAKKKEALTIAKEWATKARQMKVLKSMQLGVTYSSRTLREVSIKDISFGELEAMAEAGLIEHQEKNKSHYWVRRK